MSTASTSTGCPGRATSSTSVASRVRSFKFAATPRSSPSPRMLKPGLCEGPTPSMWSWRNARVTFSVLASTALKECKFKICTMRSPHKGNRSASKRLSTITGGKAPQSTVGRGGCTRKGAGKAGGGTSTGSRIPGTRPTLSVPLVSTSTLRPSHKGSLTTPPTRDARSDLSKSAMLCASEEFPVMTMSSTTKSLWQLDKFRWPNGRGISGKAWMSMGCTCTDAFNCEPATTRSIVSVPSLWASTWHRIPTPDSPRSNLRSVPELLSAWSKRSTVMFEQDPPTRVISSRPIIANFSPAGMSMTNSLNQSLNPTWSAPKRAFCGSAGNGGRKP
mmetsp:Transcript_65478/g.183085  ORF Transcript_65478/g.183085 Transcript_65478/m.183085 type:complete len:331 (-) Transcript_65478:48-1040(-)